MSEQLRPHHGWLATALSGFVFLVFEWFLMAEGWLGERYVEWWASSWIALALGVFALAVMLFVTSRRRLTFLEGAAGLSALNVIVLWGFGAAMLAGDQLAGLSPGATVWLSSYGCMPPGPALGGLSSAAEVSFFVLAAGAIGCLPSSTMWRPLVRAALVAVLFWGIAMSGSAFSWQGQDLFIYAGLAVVCVTFVTGRSVRRSEVTRVRVARLLAALALGTGVVRSALGSISMIRGGGGQGGSAHIADRLATAVEGFNEIVDPLPWLAGGVVLAIVMACWMPVKNKGGRPRHVTAGAFWLALLTGALVVAGAGALRFERETFRSALIEGRQYARGARPGPVATLVDGESERSRWLQIDLVSGPEANASELVFAPDTPVRDVVDEVAQIDRDRAYRLVLSD